MKGADGKCGGDAA